MLSPVFVEVARYRSMWPALLALSEIVVSLFAMGREKKIYNLLSIDPSQTALKSQRFP